MRMSETSRRNKCTPNASVGAHAKSKSATCCVPNGVGALRRAAMSAREVIAPRICVTESRIWKKSVRFVSTNTAQPASHGKSADYYQSAPAVPQSAPLMQASSPPPPVQMQSMPQTQVQPQMQTYGGTLYPPPPAGMVYASSPLRAEV